MSVLVIIGAGVVVGFLVGLAGSKARAAGDKLQAAAVAALLGGALAAVGWLLWARVFSQME